MNRTSKEQFQFAIALRMRRKSARRNLTLWPGSFSLPQSCTKASRAEICFKRTRKDIFRRRFWPRTFQFSKLTWSCSPPWLNGLCRETVPQPKTAPDFTFRVLPQRGRVSVRGHASAFRRLRVAGVIGRCPSRASPGALLGVPTRLPACKRSVH